jgi:hypothetical protein
LPSRSSVRQHSHCFRSRMFWVFAIMYVYP